MPGNTHHRARIISRRDPTPSPRIESLGPAAARCRTRRRECPKVALLFEATNAYARTLLVGIGDYILSHGPWQVHYVELTPNARPAAWIAQWEGDGLIVRGENRRVADAVDRARTAIVDLTPSRLLPRAPWVKTDDRAVGRLAAHHFFERGFRSYAFCGDPRLPWSVQRGEAFRAEVTAAGHRFDAYSPRRSRPTTDTEILAIGRWLLTLARPVAVFACYDNRGQQVLEACRRVNLAVPEEVAVLGVDNDDVLCAISPPPLSSVIPNPRRAGWEAASLLDRQMWGEAVGPKSHFIPPVGIATRQSTDILAVPDAKIADALRFIREHACEGIQVSDVVRHCPMARRALETRFKRLLQRTPRQEILRVQVNRAKELLVGTRLPVWEIADRVGFNADYLSVIFRRETGLSPRTYRQRNGMIGS